MRRRHLIPRPSRPGSSRLATLGRMSGEIHTNPRGEIGGYEDASLLLLYLISF